MAETIEVSTFDNPKDDDVTVHAPSFGIQVQGSNVPVGVRALVESIEYDQADGMADQIKITFRDPSFTAPASLASIGSLTGFGSGGSTGISLRDTKVFQAGNEIAVWMGYGPELGYVGRAIIREVNPNYPREGIPTVSIIALGKDTKMMTNAPKKSKREKGKGGRIFRDATYAEAIEQRASDYFSSLDIDPTFDPPHQIVQKVGLTDYDFIKGISNLTGYYMWADADEDGEWTLHFKNPDTLPRDTFQEREYNFVYNNKNLSTLLDADLSLAITDAVTEITAKTVSARGRVLESTFTEENEGSDDPIAELFGDTIDFDSNRVNEDSWTTASDIQLVIGDFSFDVRTNRKFKTEAELIQWSKQWFRRQREQFIMGKGTLIGIDTLRARQYHRFTGLSAGLDGLYFFSGVSHQMSASSGYLCTATVRKDVPKLA